MKNTAFFLGQVVVVIILTSGCEGWAQVEFMEGDKKINVQIKGRHFTSYLYKQELTKPVLFPVKTPSGLSVTRGFPLEQIEGESRDHPHHVGVFFTYDKVNDEGFWNNTKSPPQVKHIKFTEIKAGKTSGRLTAVMHWIGKNGKTLLVENRTMIFSVGKNENIIDFEITLTAPDTKVVFTDTKEGMFAVRVAPWLKEQGGKGRFLSSNGDETEKNVWGKRARWVRLEGEKDSRTAGIAIFHHPDSVNYPTYWHVRGYGLFAANPLGQAVFQRTRKQPEPRELNLTLMPGEKALFKFRMIVYDGARSKEQLDREFGTYAGKTETKGNS